MIIRILTAPFRYFWWFITGEFMTMTNPRGTVYLNSNNEFVER